MLLYYYGGEDNYDVWIAGLKAVAYFYQVWPIGDLGDLNLIRRTRNLVVMTKNEMADHSCLI